MDKPILGMQRYSKELGSVPGLDLRYSDGRTGDITRSTSHGGFDNDCRTINAIMERILGKKPPYPFTEDEMEGY